MNTSSRKRLLIDATGSKGWIGGLYHKKNILFSLLQNEWIRGNCRIFVVTNPEYREVFSEFEDRVKLITVRYKGLREKKIRFAALLALHGCDYVFPTIDIRICSCLHVKGINWVPDYQHYYYPEFFDETGMADRRRTDIMTVDSGYPLVLSSRTCLEDFRKYVSKTKENIYVIPFVSFIEHEVRNLTPEYIKDVCARYNVPPNEYCMTANQFWQHKNHIVILEAMKTIDPGIGFVFTGEVSDYRSDEYAERIRTLLAAPGLSGRCICTGFIDRMEQLALMAGARFIVQPSLFEGWGTVLEDAKVLDKTVLLSDIPVHREQMNDRCILFDPHDPAGLSEAVNKLWGEELSSDISRGITGMYASAAEYSTGFERLLKES